MSISPAASPSTLSLQVHSNMYCRALHIPKILNTVEICGTCAVLLYLSQKYSHPLCALTTDKKLKFLEMFIMMNSTGAKPLQTLTRKFYDPEKLQSLNSKGPQNLQSNVHVFHHGHSFSQLWWHHVLWWLLLYYKQTHLIECEWILRFEDYWKSLNICAEIPMHFAKNVTSEFGCWNFFFTFRTLAICERKKPSEMENGRQIERKMLRCGLI